MSCELFVKDHTGDKTLQQMLQHFTEALNKLFTDHFVAGPYKFVFAGSKGDLEWHWKAYTLVKYYRCNEMCSSCLASQVKPEMIYSEHGENASWRSTTISSLDFFSNLCHGPAKRRRKVPALTRVLGWHTKLLLWDIMHNLYQGNGPDFIASALTLLLRMNFYGTEIDDDIRLGIRLRVGLSACLFVSVCLYVCLYVCLPLCLSSWESVFHGFHCVLCFPTTSYDFL